MSPKAPEPIFLNSLYLPATLISLSIGMELTVFFVDIYQVYFPSVTPSVLMIATLWWGGTRAITSGSKIG